MQFLTHYTRERLEWVAPIEEKQVSGEVKYRVLSLSFNDSSGEKSLQIPPSLIPRARMS